MIRVDRRAADELRRVTIQTGYLLTAEGSALIEVGNTRVLCTVTVEENTARFLRGSGRGWITAEYAMLPRATLVRTPRESVTGRQSGRTQEIQRLIGRSLRAVARLEALGERTLLVDCDVLQADGGTRTAAITGAYVALRQAVDRLVRNGAIPSSPLEAAVAAVSVGVVDGQPYLDLNYEEDSRAEVDFNVVMTDRREFIEIQGTAEGKPFDKNKALELLSLAEKGIGELFVRQAEALRSGS
jgi:ribonuclease PH